MGRRVWNIWITVLLAAFGVGCGGTGGGPSDSGSQFVFEARGRLSLSVAMDSENPTVLTLTATLLDPQGFPFRNARLTFAADFNDITIIQQDIDPSTCDPTTCSNRGAAITDDNGQAHVTVIAGLTTGWSRVIAEAPPALNISTGITVEITGQGFISLGTLSIVPSAVTFVNPTLGPDDPGSPPTTATFQAVGGTPPYRWDHANQDLGSIQATGIPNVNQTAEYTLTGPVPTPNQPTALLDTVTLYDADGSEASAMVSVVFADCTLMADQTMVTLPNVPGNTFQIDISDGAPPFAVTQQFPGTLNVAVEVIDENGNVIPGELCDATGEECTITLSLPAAGTNTSVVEPGMIFVRDARGCKATVTVTVEAPCTLMADQTKVTLIGSAGNNFQIDVSDGVPPFAVTQLFPDTETSSAIDVLVEVIDGNGNIIPFELCDTTGERCVMTFTLPTDFRTVIPGTILIRDVRSCKASIELTIEPCGNGVIDSGEECDGSDFPGLLDSCANVEGPDALGILFCTDTCTIDTSNCQAAPAAPATAPSSSCNNGIIDAGELCDTDDFRGLTCASLEGTEATGSLFCTATCTIESSDCQAAPEPASLCNNGVINAGEPCDTDDFRGLTCTSLYGVGATGSLVCTDSCTIESSDCEAAPASASLCGNEIIDAGEPCDIDDFDDLTCASYKEVGAIGSLFCTATCTINSNDCVAAPASASLCGNEIIDPGEQCDTLSLGGATCEDLGLVGGDLACNDDCTLNTGDCSYD